MIYFGSGRTGIVNDAAGGRLGERGGRDGVWAGADDCDAGNTSLILAAQGGHTEIARELLQKGADANTANKNGEWRGASRAGGAEDGGMFRVTGA
jgi:hypothetical protein